MGTSVLSLSKTIQNPYLSCYNKLNLSLQQNTNCIEKIKWVVQKIFLCLACIISYPLYCTGKLIQPSQTNPTSITSVQPTKMLPTLSEEAAIQEYMRIYEEFPQLNPKEHPALFRTGASAEARGKNRYGNILPNEPTRFKFSDPHFYYNANLLLNGTAIAAQGPTNQTKADFWKMVWESGSNTIVMVTDQFEKGKEKCAIYWPQHRAQVENIYDQATLTMTDESQKSVEGFEIKVRKFQFKNGNDAREIVQYQFCNWEDQGVVSPKALADLTATIGNRLNGTRNPPIVHCSAGIGRTGTFLTAYSAYIRLLAGENDPQMIRNIVRELRSPEKGRNGMIQNEIQYYLAHQTIGELIANRARYTARRKVL